VVVVMFVTGRGVGPKHARCSPRLQQLQRSTYYPAIQKTDRKIDILSDE
jgi:hypothetical protein